MAGQSDCNFQHQNAQAAHRQANLRPGIPPAPPPQQQQQHPPHPQQQPHQHPGQPHAIPQSQLPPPNQPMLQGPPRPAVNGAVRQPPFQNGNPNPGAPPFGQQRPGPPPGQQPRPGPPFQSPTMRPTMPMPPPGANMVAYNRPPSRAAPIDRELAGVPVHILASLKAEVGMDGKDVAQMSPEEKVCLFSG